MGEMGGQFFFSSCTFVKFLGELFSHQVAFSQKTLSKSQDNSDQPFTVKKDRRSLSHAMKCMMENFFGQSIIYPKKLGWGLMST